MTHSPRTPWQDYQYAWKTRPYPWIEWSEIVFLAVAVLGGLVR